MKQGLVDQRSLSTSTLYFHLPPSLSPSMHNESNRHNNNKDEAFWSIFIVQLTCDLNTWVVSRIDKGACDWNQNCKTIICLLGKSHVKYRWLSLSLKVALRCPRKRTWLSAAPMQLFSGKWYMTTAEILKCLQLYPSFALPPSLSLMF